MENPILNIPMRPLKLLCLSLALAFSMATHAQTQSAADLAAAQTQAQTDGAALGASSLASGPLTPQAISTTGTTTGANNVWGDKYTGTADSGQTGLSNSGSMIGVGNAARGKSVAEFKQYDGNREDQANQATYFLNRNPVLKPAILPTDPMVVSASSSIGTPIFASSTDKVCKQTEVKTTYDNSTIYTCLETYNPYVIPCSVLSDVNFTNIPAPVISGTIGSYTCPPGQTHDGVSCTKVTSTTAPPITTPTCPNGGNISGSNCISTTGTAATPNYTCGDGQTPIGDQCPIQVTAPATKQTCPTNMGIDILTANYSGDPNKPGISYCLSWGYTVTWDWITYYYDLSSPYNLYNEQQNYFNYYSGQYGDKNYFYDFTGGGVGINVGANGMWVWGELGKLGCPSGQVLSNNVCVSTTTSPAQISGYTCPSGGSYNGMQCISTSTTPATIAYSCPAGAVLTNTSTCTTTTTITTAATPSYVCPTGYTPNGTQCTGTATDKMSEGSISGCGALEGLSN